MYETSLKIVGFVLLHKIPKEKTGPKGDLKFSAHCKFSAHRLADSVTYETCLIPIIPRNRKAVFFAISNLVFIFDFLIPSIARRSSFLFCQKKTFLVVSDLKLARKRIRMESKLEARPKLLRLYLVLGRVVYLEFSHKRTLSMYSNILYFKDFRKS